MPELPVTDMRPILEAINGGQATASGEITTVKFTLEEQAKSRYEGLANYEQEIINEENVLCKTHFNIMLLEDEDAVLGPLYRAGEDDLYQCRV